MKRHMFTRKAEKSLTCKQATLQFFARFIYSRVLGLWGCFKNMESNFHYYIYIDPNSIVVRIYYFRNSLPNQQRIAKYGGKFKFCVVPCLIQLSLI